MKLMTFEALTKLIAKRGIFLEKCHGESAYFACMPHYKMVGFIGSPLDKLLDADRYRVFHG